MIFAEILYIIHPARALIGCFFLEANLGGKNVQTSRIHFSFAKKNGF
jgi:hypothetical protein